MMSFYLLHLRIKEINQNESTTNNANTKVLPSIIIPKEDQFKDRVKKNELPEEYKKASQEC